MTDTLRNGELTDLAAMLESQRVRKLDVVAPSGKITADPATGNIVVEDMDGLVTESGVTTVAGAYRPTDVAVEQLGERLGIPVQYLRKLQGSRPDLFADNINGWLHGATGSDPDPRSFLLRAFRAEDGDDPGTLRAVLSDRFKVIDHFDILLAAIEGIQEAGVPYQVQACDLTERRMYVRIHAEAVSVAAPELLAGYVSPYGGATGTDNPTVFAGFVLTNSEVGEGAWTLAPQIVVRICTNGMTMRRDVFRQTHLGGRLSEGVVRWSEDTLQKQLALVKAKSRDTVATFLDVDYVRAQVALLTEQAGVQLADPAKNVEVVTTRLQYTDAQRADVLRMFIQGARPTAGGVMQAVTAAAQLQPSGDGQYAMELDAVPALELAAANAAVTS